MMQSLPRPPLGATLTTHILRACVVFALLFGASGCFDSCQPPFPPSNQIDKFRILAVQLDPPEATPGEAVKAKFLSVNAQGLVNPSEFLDLTKCFADGGVADPTAIWVGCLPGVDGDPAATNACGQIPGFGPPSDGGTQGGSDGGFNFADGGFGDQFQLFFHPVEEHPHGLHLRTTWTLSPLTSNAKGPRLSSFSRHCTKDSSKYR